MISFSMAEQIKEAYHKSGYAAAGEHAMRYLRSQESANIHELLIAAEMELSALANGRRRSGKDEVMRIVHGLQSVYGVTCVGANSCSEKKS